jgi:aspartate dehydrogenase
MTTVQGGKRVAVVGLGAIGRAVATALDGGMDGLTLAAVAVSNPDKHHEFLAGLANSPPILPFVGRGKTAIILSVGALLVNDDLIALAKAHGGQIVVPTGALIGLDAVTAAAEGEIRSVRMVTRKPVRGLAGAPYIVEHNIDIESITEPLKIFDGTAREAAKGFPANLNVAVALSLAGIGPDLQPGAVRADAALTRNVHRVEVDADSASISMTIENIPSENPKTGRITALSVIAYLRKQGAALRVGT